jgi:RNA polymerase sigma-70 factor (ECF subfamily)
MLTVMPPSFEPAAASPPIADEAALLARLHEGDEAAFEETVRRYGPPLSAVLRRYLPDEHEAQDALQDTFLSAFKALPRFQAESTLGTWLHRIAVNAALMKLRTRRRHPERPIDELLPTFLDDGHRAEPRGPWAPRPDDVAVGRENVELVRRAIDRLPESYRTVLLLRDIDERTTEETAALLEMSVANVKTRLHRARQALRELLDRELGEKRS